jgi:ABC-type xylose transport system permease subunit
MIQSLFIVLSIIIMIFGSVLTHYNSQIDVPITKQNENIYTMSIIIVSLGVILIVGIIGGAIAYPVSVFQYPSLIVMLVVIGIVLTAVGSVAIETYNNKSISDKNKSESIIAENKSDKYIKLSVTLTSIGTFAIAFFAVSSYYSHGEVSAIPDLNIESL